MILIKVLIVLVLVNPSLPLLYSHYNQGSIDKRFHEDELTKILNVKNPQEFKFISRKETFPTNFDARTKWPMCENVINSIVSVHHILNCAEVAVMVTNDRSCIVREGRKLIRLSYMDLVRCCDACRRNYKLEDIWKSKSNLITTFYFMKRVGVATENCITSFYVDVKQNPCKRHCESEQVPYVKFKFSKISIGTKLRRFGVADIQVEIKEHGPIAGMIRGIPEDFLYNYTDEVYIYRGANFIDGGYAHAIKILGWGKENRVKYWLCANTWGTNWGKLGGHFKIRRGENELGIEDFVIAPNPSNETADNIFNPTGEITNGISCTKTTQVYKIIVIIVLIIFRL